MQGCSYRLGGEANRDADFDLIEQYRLYSGTFDEGTPTLPLQDAVAWHAVDTSMAGRY
jgi:hypothetical protein